MFSSQYNSSDPGEDNNDDDNVSIIDPNCGPENPYRVTFRDITSAAFLIKSGIECTPCTVSLVIERVCGEVFFQIYSGQFIIIFAEIPNFL